MNEDLENHSKDQLFHSAQWWHISQPPRETKRESINSGRKYYQEFSFGYALVAWRIWKGDVLIADIEELQKLDASKIYPRRLDNAKEVLISQKDGEFVFLVADGSAKLSGRDYESQEPTLRREFTVRRESQRRISWRQGRFST